MSVIDHIKDDLNTDHIEATLGRILQDGKNKPFAHTCDHPSQTCECWIATEGEHRTEYIWLSVRPNRRTRRYKDAIRKAPLRNDGTPKRFTGAASRRRGQARELDNKGRKTKPRIQRSTGTSETESGTTGQSREDR